MRRRIPLIATWFILYPIVLAAKCGVCYERENPDGSKEKICIEVEKAQAQKIKKSFKTYETVLAADKQGEISPEDLAQVQESFQRFLTAFEEEAEAQRGEKQQTFIGAAQPVQRSEIERLEAVAEIVRLAELLLNAAKRIAK